MPDSFPAAIVRKVLSAHNPALDVPYLARLRALYDGGYSLLHNPTVLAELFPKHRQESEKVYEERCKRAIYIAHASEIVDYITSSLSGDPIRMKTATSDKLDDWYTKFAADVSPPGGEKCSLHTFARSQATEMLITRTAWARVDMPAPGEFDSLATQERAGNLDAYVVPVQAETVIDWNDGAGGGLEWVVLEDCQSPRPSFDVGRDSIVETWTIWTRTGWAKYQVVRKEKEPVELEKPVNKLKEGEHGFGRVPLIRTSLPKGLWAMDTLESPAREHFNKRSALAWSEFQSLLPELYEFKGPEEATDAAPISETQEDPSRATKQTRGPGYVQERGHQDKAAWIGPSPEPFKETRLSLAELRDNMHQVMHMMAMSVEQNKTALGRSAASKKEDRASTDVVLTALGQYLREHITGIFEMVSRGRGDRQYVDQWQAEGASQFATDSADTIISRGVELAAAPQVKSPTFQRIVQKDLAAAWLGEKATEETMQIVEKELEENVTLDSMGPPAITLPVLNDGEEGDAKDEEGEQAGKQKESKEAA